MQKQLGEAQRQGDDAEVAALRKRMESISVELAKERLEKLKAGKEGPVDPAVIDLFAAWSTSITATNRDANQRILREIAERMGPLPAVNVRTLKQIEGEAIELNEGRGRWKDGREFKRSV